MRNFSLTNRYRKDIQVKNKIVRNMIRSCRTKFYNRVRIANIILKKIIKIKKIKLKLSNYVKSLFVKFFIVIVIYFFKQKIFTVFDFFVYDEGSNYKATAASVFSNLRKYVKIKYNPKFTNGFSF